MINRIKCRCDFPSQFNWFKRIHFYKCVDRKSLLCCQLTSYTVVPLWSNIEGLIDRTVLTHSLTGNRTLETALHSALRFVLFSMHCENRTLQPVEGMQRWKQDFWRHTKMCYSVLQSILCLMILFHNVCCICLHFYCSVKCIKSSKFIEWEYWEIYFSVPSDWHFLATKLVTALILF